VFFVDLPTDVERAEIVKIHLAKRKRDAAAIDVQTLVRQTKGFSGAEIEQAVISALFDSFEKNAPLNTEMISRAVRETVPLSTTMKEEINALRDWASGRARKASLEEKEVAAAPGERKFEL
jgi:SpoVK/Ycf46/Vps4 family AAA+-type ATPase